jgi:UDP-N-acetylmuramate--alanine ligase
MQGLAQVLVQGGIVVTASDPSPPNGPGVTRLRRLRVRVHSHPGHPPRPCPRTARWLVCAPETSRLDPERLSAEGRGLVIRTPGECLGAMLRQGTGLAVAGGPAASSAAAMIGWILTQSGRDPTVVLRTAAQQLGGWGRLGAGPHVVVHADIGASGEPWAVLGPSVAILLDDPADDGGGLGARSAAAADGRGLLESMPEEGLVLAWPSSALARAARHGAVRSVEWLALERGFDWWGADLRADRGRFRFRVFLRGRFVTEMRLQVPGRRNVLSALAAVAACTRLEVPAVEIQQALEEFTGVSRDFESRGSYRGVTLVDDARRHPAGCNDAMVLARQVFGDRRIWAVLQAPAGLEDREEPSGYVNALALADEVLLAGKGGRTPHVLERVLAAAGVRARSVPDDDAAIWELDRHLQPGDVLVTLGAGDEGTISDAFIRRLSRDRPGG